MTDYEVTFNPADTFAGGNLSASLVTPSRYNFSTPASELGTTLFVDWDTSEAGTPWLYDDAIVDAILGFAYKFTVVSGEFSVRTLFTADSESFYSSAIGDDLVGNNASFAPGDHTLVIGADPFVFGESLRWYFNPIDNDEVVRRMKLTGYPHAYAEWRYFSGIPYFTPVAFAIEDFRLVGFTADEPSGGDCTPIQWWNGATLQNTTSTY